MCVGRLVVKRTTDSQVDGARNPVVRRVLVRRALAAPEVPAYAA